MMVPSNSSLLTHLMDYKEEERQRQQQQQAIVHGQVHGQEPAPAASASAWEPLEGTPEVFNVLAKHLGLDTTTIDDDDDDDDGEWNFVDVLGFDQEIITLTIPNPNDCVALILLYPTATTSRSTATMSTQQQRQSPATNDTNHNDGDTTSLFSLKQIVGGTCGTLAVAHAIANSRECHDSLIRSKSILAPTTTDTDRTTDLWKLPTGERSRQFISNEIVHRAHHQAVQASNSRNKKTPQSSQAGIRQGRHFLTLVQDYNYGDKEVQHGERRRIWLLNGRDPPVCFIPEAEEEGEGRGTTTTSNATAVFLWDAIAHIKGILKVMSTDQQLNCSLMALVRQPKLQLESSKEA